MQNNAKTPSLGEYRERGREKSEREEREREREREREKRAELLVGIVFRWRERVHVRLG